MSQMAWNSMKLTGRAESNVSHESPCSDEDLDEVGTIALPDRVDAC